MSKLTKFKPALAIEEAAELLGRLIDEVVTPEDIESLFLARRISMIFKVNCQIYKLTEEIESPLAISHSRCFDEPRLPVAPCTAITLPSDEVYIRSRDGNALHRAIALRDCGGNFYVLSSKESDNNFTFLSELSGHFPEVHRGFVTPDEIYRIAEEANTDALAIPRGMYLERMLGYWVGTIYITFTLASAGLSTSRRRPVSVRLLMLQATSKL